MLALVTVCLVTFAKDQFSWLTGSGFLMSVVGMVLAGALALIVAALLLPVPKTWRTWVVVLWSVVALTSPLFGWVFLLPWALLLVTAPVIFVILRNWSAAAS